MKEQVRILWEKVKANRAVLEACAEHDFVDDDKDILAPSVCSKCKGTTQRVHAHWYKEGLKHGFKRGALMNPTVRSNT